MVSIQIDTGLGSGVIFDPSSLILTNNHVVSGATRLTFDLVNGRHFKGAVLGSDPGFDLAVAKIDGGDNLPLAAFGNSGALQAGQFVIAIGNPYGLNHTVTTGVISAVDRPVLKGPGSYNQPMLQTDAAINPGNSGGPLVDLNGQIIGINTLIQTTSQGTPAVGVGFAVPVDTAKRIVPRLVASGRITKSGQPYLGATIGDAMLQGLSGRRSPFGTAAPPGIDYGPIIGEPTAGGPAQNAGVRTGDVITMFDGREIYSRDDLLRVIVLHTPGDWVPLTIFQGGQEVMISLTIGETPVATD